MFPDLGEFRLVQKILENSASMQDKSPAFRNWLSAGDDCAIFDGWLATKDLSVENVHFRLDWSTPEQAVEKHIVSNVSDISAMGGKPRFALFGLCVNKNWSPELCERVANAVAQGFAKRGIALIGGDTVSGDVAMFSTTLLGEQVTERALVRSGAKPGDKVYVAGTLGKSAAGLWLLLNHPENTDKFTDLVEYHLNPKIDENMGAKLVQNGADGACMDISDGLSSELNHLALSSQVQIEIEKELIPIDPSVQKMADYYGISALELAMNGGEEYELLFTVSAKNDIFLSKLKSEGIICIGTVKEGSGVQMVSAGVKEVVKAKAWSHI